ncbi:hypothetical protein Q1695_012227 [Nippostrongylus brasiliensis]|nr:hypothetical protein Q1695_012227 [Nippostrongylus brasiliensis]
MKLQTDLSSKLQYDEKKSTASDPVVEESSEDSISAVFSNQQPTTSANVGDFVKRVVRKMKPDSCCLTPKNCILRCNNCCNSSGIRPLKEKINSKLSGV